MPTPFTTTQALGWYGDPEADDTWEYVDELILPVCKRICESGWAWTAESCQGHPDDNGDVGPWANNTKPMLRFVCANEHIGHLMSLLLQALGELSDVSQPTPLQSPGGFEAWPTRGDTHTAVLVYLPAVTVGQRNAGIRVYERVAEPRHARTR
jgi:hypothetical protein